MEGSGVTSAPPADSTAGSSTTEPSSHGTYGRSNSPPGPSRSIAFRCGPNRRSESVWSLAAEPLDGAPRRERSHWTSADRDVVTLLACSVDGPVDTLAEEIAIAEGSVVVLSLACFACVIELVSAQRSGLHGIQSRLAAELNPCASVRVPPKTRPSLRDGRCSRLASRSRSACVRWWSVLFVNLSEGYWSEP